MGNALSYLTQEQIQQLKQLTPFEEADMVKLLKRYKELDPSEKGTAGIKYRSMLTVPELKGNPIIPRLLELYIDPSNRTMYPENFIYFFALLSKNTPVNKKRAAAWACFDVNGSGGLNEQELFYIYRLLYHNGLSEDQILLLVHQTLSQAHLSHPGEMNQEEFNEMLSDWDITNLFTADLGY